MSNKKEQDKQSELSNDALDKVINPEEKSIKKLDSEHIEINNEKYKIVKDYREALDLELLEERYSDFLEKYDYIVGDMSYGKLRLRGFYHDDVKKIPIDMRISYLEDYLLEYCSFGCAYFVLENSEPNKKQITHHYESSSKSTNKPSKKSYSRNKSGKPQPSKKPYKKKQTSKPANQKEVTQNKPKDKRSFTKKHRNEPSESDRKKEEIKEVKSDNGKTRFQIRKKKD